MRYVKRRLVKTGILIKKIESGVFFIQSEDVSESPGAKEVILHTSICREELMSSGDQILHCLVLSFICMCIAGKPVAATHCKKYLVSVLTRKNTSELVDC